MSNEAFILYGLYSFIIVGLVYMFCTSNMKVSDEWDDDIEDGTSVFNKLD